ncbi:MAG: hypothetical protein IT430_18010 [Phycisphaerales bacterium]|nr:hypothetical protein [Phycisphaerales bacterium]
MASVFIAVGPFWKALVVRYADYPPNTALILIVANEWVDDPDDPLDAMTLDHELMWRLREYPVSLRA